MDLSQKTLGAKIAALRKIRNMTQEQLAAQFPLCVLTQRIPTSAIQSYHQTQRRTATILVQTGQNTKSLQT